MAAGSVLSWMIAPPLLMQNHVIDELVRRKVLLWVMWPATGMLIAGGLTALVLKWGLLVKTFRNLSEAEISAGDFPMKWVIGGSLLCAVALVVVQHTMLGMPIWMTVVAMLLSVPLMLVGIRVLGETNWGPISTMANLTQALFGVIAPGDLRASMVSSGITGAVAAESEGLMQDYKVGSMIGSTPRVLAYMQLLAVPVGALALAWMYPVLRDTYGISGEHAQLSSPVSQRWVGFAKIVTQQLSGPAAMTPEAIARLAWMKSSFAIGALFGIILTLLEQRPSWRRFVPSPTGMGIGVLIPISAVTTICLGAAGDQVWRTLRPQSHGRYSIATASGFIAGEAIVAVIIPLLVTLGVMRLAG
jgi:uncharacterized oligopeptide transporter (OPT) family protein